jgi:hypothetical protein
VMRAVCRVVEGDRSSVGLGSRGTRCFGPGQRPDASVPGGAAVAGIQLPPRSDVTPSPDSHPPARGCLLVERVRDLAQACTQPAARRGRRTKARDSRVCMAFAASVAARVATTTFKGSHALSVAGLVPFHVRRLGEPVLSRLRNECRAGGGSQEADSSAHEPAGADKSEISSGGCPSSLLTRKR